jgi:hypothetical protein
MFGDPSGGFFVFLLFGLMALAGIGMFLTGGALMFRGGPTTAKTVMMLLGALAMSPAVWLLFGLVKAEIPQTLSWDFSTSRGIAPLDPKRRSERENWQDRDAEYGFQGNLRTTLQLPAGRIVKGNADRVLFVEKGGQVTTIVWTGQYEKTDAVYAQAKQILAEMKLTGHGLHEWYAKARGGDKGWFSHELESEPKIAVDIRTYGRPGPEPTPADREWFVNVNVEWKEGTR